MPTEDTCGQPEIFSHRNPCSRPKPWHSVIPSHPAKPSDVSDVSGASAARTASVALVPERLSDSRLVKAESDRRLSELTRWCSEMSSNVSVERREMSVCSPSSVMDGRQCERKPEIFSHRNPCSRPKPWQVASVAAPGCLQLPLRSTRRCFTAQLFPTRRRKWRLTRLSVAHCWRLSTATLIHSSTSTSGRFVNTSGGEAAILLVLVLTLVVLAMVLVLVLVLVSTDTGTGTTGTDGSRQPGRGWAFLLLIVRVVC